MKAARTSQMRDESGFDLFFAPGFVLAARGDRVELYLESGSIGRLLDTADLVEAFDANSLPVAECLQTLTEGLDGEDDDRPLLIVLSRAGALVDVWNSRRTWKQVSGGLTSHRPAVAS